MRWLVSAQQRVHFTYRSFQKECPILDSLLALRFQRHRAQVLRLLTGPPLTTDQPSIRWSGAAVVEVHQWRQGSCLSKDRTEVVTLKLCSFYYCYGIKIKTQ